MIRYIGTKVIQAEPLNRGDYNIKRGWTIPAGENPADEGYLVQYPDGYISWSPKGVFEEAYRPCEGMTFGLAIEALKRGAKVARAGWNGKGMWLVLQPGTPSVELKEGSVYRKALGDALSCEILGHIDMWTTNAQGRRAMLPGWLASQTDMLAEDWSVVA